MGRRSILSLSGLDWITRFVCVKTSGCGLILLTNTRSSHSRPQSRSLAGTGVVCPFAESGNRLDPISRLALNPSISGHFREYFRGSFPCLDDSTNHENGRRTVALRYG